MKAITIEEMKRQMERVEYGGICYVPSDNAFTRKARYLQIIRRRESGAESGWVMRNGTQVRYAHLADDGKECNRNFLSDEIFQYAKKRVSALKPYETIAEERLFCNFLSSQPMAFNLFYPLMQMVKKDENIQKRLAEVVKTLLDGTVIEQIDRITEVGIEFIPPYWEKCLHDKTAMDAFFRFLTADGRKGIIAIETKYTDKLGTNEAQNITPALSAANNLKEIFTPEALGCINGRSIKITQLFRNLLLTEQVRQMEELDESISIVIAPLGNTSNTTEEQDFRQMLRTAYQYKFQHVNLEDFVMKLKQIFPEEQIFEDFYKRYLEFGLVELYGK